MPRNRLRNGLLLTLGMAVPLAAGWGALHSESVLRWAAQRLEARANGQLQAHGVHGTLSGPIRVDALRYRSPRYDMEAQQATLDWSPWRLLAGQLHVSRLTAPRLRIAWRPSAAAPTLPQSLQPPLTLHLEQLHVARLQLDGPGAPTVLHDLAASLRGDARAWHVTLWSVRTPTTRASGQVTLQTQRPFALGGGLRLDGPPTADYTLTADLGGTLTHIDLSADARARQAQAHATGLLTPFAPGIVERLQLTATQLHPRDWLAHAPDADISLKFQARRGPGDAIVGQLEAINRRPGKLDAGRLPWVGAHADFAGTWAALALPTVAIDLGPGGQLQGSGRLNAGALDLVLHSRNLDPQGLHGRWRTMQLTGEFGIHPAGTAQQLTAALRQGTYRFDFDGTVDRSRLQVSQVRAQAGGGALTARGEVGFAATTPFRLSGTVTRFDPSRFGRYPAASINSTLQLHGVSAPVPQLQADWQLRPSRLFGQPSAGRGTLRAQALDNPNIALDLALDIGPTHATVKGTVRDPARLGPMDLQLALRGRSLGDLYPILGLPTPATPPYRLAGRLTQRDRRWDFRGFRGQVGQSDLSGDFQVDRRQVPQFLRGTLVSNRLDLKDLAGFIGGNTQPSGVTRTAGAGRVLPDAPLGLDKLGAANADIHFRGRHIQTQKLPLSNMATHLKLAGGRLTLDPLVFGVADGQLVSRVAVDARQAVAHSQADVQVRALKLNQLFPGVKLTYASVGQVEGRARLAMRGNTFADMLGSADGDVTLMMNGGAISDLLLRLANIDLAHAALTLLRGDRNIPIRCMVADFGAENGHLRARTLVLDTEHTRLNGDGEIDLQNERLALRLTARPKDSSLLALRGPILLDGRLGAPNVHADWKGVMSRGGIAALLGAVAAPVAALVPLVELGQAKDVDCAPLIAQARQRIAGPVHP